MKMKDQNHSRKIALIVGVIVNFLVTYVSSATNIALSHISLTFSLDSVFLGWITSSYLLFTAILLIPFGKLGDMYARKRIISYGIIIFVLANFISAISISGTMLLISKIITAIGSAMIIGNVYSLIASVYPKTKKGKPLAISVAAGYVGNSIGPALGGFLTFFGWRNIFIFAIPIGIVVFVIISRFKGEGLKKYSGGFNITSISIFALSLITLMYGLLNIETSFGILAIIGLIGCIIFIWLQKKVSNPLIPPKLLFNRIYIINNLTSLVNYGPGILTIFLLSLYLQNVRDISPEIAGLFLCVPPVFVAISSVLVGRLRDFTRPIYIAAIGMAITALGLTFFIFLNINTSFTYIITGMAIFGFGYGLSAASSTEISLKYVKEKFYGISNASLATVHVVGQMIGMGLTTAVLALFMGSAVLTPDNSSAFMESTKIIFTIYAVLCYISIYGYFFIRKNK